MKAPFLAMPGHMQCNASALVPAPEPPVESQSCNNCCQQGNWFYWTVRSQGGRYRGHIPSLPSETLPRVSSSHHKHAHVYAACLGVGQSSLILPWAAAAEPMCAHLTHSRAFVFISSLRQMLELLHVASSKVLGGRGSVAPGGGSSAALI